MPKGRDCPRHPGKVGSGRHGATAHDAGGDGRRGHELPNLGHDAETVLLLVTAYGVLRLPRQRAGARSSPGAPRRTWRVAGQSAGAMQLTLKTLVHTVETRCMTCQPNGLGAAPPG